MENRIKDNNKLCTFVGLFADRTSAATMRASQLRLWFASMAYMLLCALRRRWATGGGVPERVGFEPTVRLHVHTLSKRAP
jgi:hypothetical protein